MALIQGEIRQLSSSHPRLFAKSAIPPLAADPPRWDEQAEVAHSPVTLAGLFRALVESNYAPSRANCRERTTRRGAPHLSVADRRGWQRRGPGGNSGCDCPGGQLSTDQGQC